MKVTKNSFSPTPQVLEKSEFSKKNVYEKWGYTDYQFNQDGYHTRTWL